MGQWQMKNERLTVTIDDKGAELVSIYDQKFDREVIWQADPRYWKRHAPVLFPNVGKYAQGGFLYEGKRYTEGQHGFARDCVFERLASGGDFVTHRLVSDAATRDRYPFDFSLEITHRLKGQQLEITWRVENTGDHAMYFTIGGHPAFNVPVLPETSYSDYELQFDTHTDCLNYKLIDTASGTLINEQTYELMLRDHRYQLRTDLFDRDALVFDDGQIQWAGINLPDHSPYVSVKCEGFPNFGIWAAPGAPYVCLEPWCGRCDNRGFEGEIADKDGINRLESGAIFEKGYSIMIEG